MRLTKKKEDGGYVIKYDLSTYYICHFHPKDVFDVFAKLGQLEDIEEEFDIDLVTFFKIRKHCYDRKPIFIKGKKGIIMSSCRVELCYKSVAVHTGDYGADSYPLKDYGKTWALTKEELL